MRDMNFEDVGQGIPAEGLVRANEQVPRRPPVLIHVRPVQLTANS
jgi:hypothetical protein